jgi:hypothetical protein
MFGYNFFIIKLDLVREKKRKGIMAIRFLNATEKNLMEDDKEVPQIMPAYVRDKKVHRLPDPEAGVVIYVEVDVYDIASQERSDLRVAK